MVIDTNVLLVSISRKSDLHWLYDNLLSQSYTLCVTTEILLEYAEIIERFMGAEASERFFIILDNLPNIERITSYYKFRLLNDEDDDKFVDCCIAANAEYIVSHDKDFNVLRNIDFPKVIVIDTKKFKKIISKQKN